MASVSYRIFGDAEGWAIEHDGKVGGRYELPEAAFEAAVSAASLALKQRQNVDISVTFPEGEKNTAASGATESRRAGQEAARHVPDEGPYE